MQKSPYRDLENSPEEKILDRFKEIFGDKKTPYESKYVASNSYGFGYVEAHTENDQKSGGELTTYSLEIGKVGKPITIKIKNSEMGTFMNGYKGFESANDKLNRHQIEEIINEIQLSHELKREIFEPINGNKNKRAKIIAGIQKKGTGSSHTWVSNVTADGLLSLEKKTTRTQGLLIIELEVPGEKKRLRFSVNADGDVAEIVKEKSEGMERKTLEIERIRGGFSNRKEIKKGTKEFDEAIGLLDKNLETFKLPFNNETPESEDANEIRSGVRKKINNV